MIVVSNVLLTCDCGQLPLKDAQHANAADAWLVASAHVALNPTLCRPRMTRVDVPVGLTRARLEYLRGELRGERLSYGELHELQSLVEHIDAGDIELLEAAGIPERSTA